MSLGGNSHIHLTGTHPQRTRDGWGMKSSRIQVNGHDILNVASRIASHRAAVSFNPAATCAGHGAQRQDRR